MRSFFKSFFASLLALIIFCVILFFVAIGLIAGLVSSGKPTLGSKAILYLDLTTDFQEQSREDVVATFTSKDNASTPGLYDVVRLIHLAKADSAIRGIFIRCEGNANGFAASEELRTALLDFKTSHKFIYAYGDIIAQKAYYVANVADHIYCNPLGSMEWKGLSAQIMFIKNALQKLEIQPQIFYDGKFKSATEPLREEHMTDANKLQTSEWLNDLNNSMLIAAQAQRNVDTATLATYAREGKIQTAYDAVKYKLIDDLKYRDQVLAEIRTKLNVEKDAEVNFVTLSKYAEASDLDNSSSNDRIAVIYAQGDIVYGKGQEGQIGSDEYVRWIRKARLDKNVKAIVLRVNSPGGSSLASDIIWREIILAKKDGKPVVVSMGDYAASGGYYIACGADSIFAEPSTITGSIGVFTIIPNLESFYKNKLGVTFDGVKTAPFADEGNINRPLTDAEKQFVQAGVDSFYVAFKTRVAEGRHLTLNQVEAIAQGRVWTGERARKNGLVDQLGNLKAAISCASKLAKVTDYQLREYPEAKSTLEKILNNYSYTVKAKAIKEEIGVDQYNMLLQFRNIKAMVGVTQVRMPYELDIR